MIKETVSMKQSVIIDMTNLTQEQRVVKLRMFPTTIYKHKAIVVLTGEKELSENLIKRFNKKIPEDIIEKQKLNFELPGLDEFHEIEYRF